MFAAHQRLDRLTVLLDANNSQVDGPVDTITTIEPIAAKWGAFGWDAVDLDGHDACDAAALAAGEAARDAGPARQVLICRTSTRARAGLPAARRRRPLHQAARPGSPRPRSPNSRKNSPAMTPDTTVRSPVLEPALPDRAQALRPGAGELARQRRDDVLCLSGDLTRQCEIDLFADAFPERFIHAGMAEANMIGVAAALARSGLYPVRAHLRRVRHPPPAGPDHQRRRLPAAAGPDRRLHARRLQPRRPEPPGDRRRGPDAVRARDDGDRRRRRGAGTAGLRGDRRPARPGIPAAQARRDPGHFRSRPPPRARPRRRTAPAAPMSALVRQRHDARPPSLAAPRCWTATGSASASSASRSSSRWTKPRSMVAAACKVVLTAENHSDHRRPRLRRRRGAGRGRPWPGRCAGSACATRSPRRPAPRRTCSPSTACPPSPSSMPPGPRSACPADHPRPPTDARPGEYSPV